MLGVSPQDTFRVGLGEEMIPADGEPAFVVRFWSLREMMAATAWAHDGARLARENDDVICRELLERLTAAVVSAPVALDALTYADAWRLFWRIVSGNRLGKLDLKNSGSPSPSPSAGSATAAAPVQGAPKPTSNVPPAAERDATTAADSASSDSSAVRVETSPRL